MSDVDDFDVIEPAPAGSVTLGDGSTATTVVVKAMRVGQLPAFARALRPISSEIEHIVSSGASVDSVLSLVETRFENVVEALHAATGAPKEAINDSTIEQALALLLAVIAANKDFLKGRLAQALKTASLLKPGAGLTP